MIRVEVHSGEAPSNEEVKQKIIEQLKNLETYGTNQVDLNEAIEIVKGA
jgi:hypothetical protein